MAIRAAKEKPEEVPQPAIAAVEAPPTLIQAACQAYGIGEEYVFASAIVSEGDPPVQVAKVVTNGGIKVQFRAGDTVTRQLKPEQVGSAPPKPPPPPMEGKPYSPGYIPPKE